MGFSTVEVSDILSDHFALDQATVAITRLSGYEDENYMVRSLSNEKVKYILKIMNSDDSCRKGLIEAVAGVILKVGDICKDIQVPQVISSLNGQSVVTIGEGRSIRKVMLLTFIPGLEITQLHFDDGSYLKFCYEVGAFAGKLNSSMKSICDVPDVLFRSYMGIKLENIGVLKNKIHFLTDTHIKAICDDTIRILQRFCSGCEYRKLTKGVIHGDLTINNMIFDDQKSVTGVIDFMDTSISSYVFEFAATLVTLMHDALLMDEDPTKSASIALTGYLRWFELNLADLDILYHAVLGRLCVIRVCCGPDILERELANHTRIDLNTVDNLMTTMWKRGKDGWKNDVINSDDRDLHA